MKHLTHSQADKIRYLSIRSRQSYQISNPKNKLMASNIRTCPSETLKYSMVMMKAARRWIQARRIIKYKSNPCFQCR